MSEINDAVLRAWNEGNMNPAIRLGQEGRDLRIEDQTLIDDLNRSIYDSFMPMRIRCVDDRLPSSSAIMDVGIPGSGVLLPVSEFSRMVGLCKDIDLEQITFHPDCGAYRKYLSRQGYSIEEPKAYEWHATRLNDDLATMFGAREGNISILPLAVKGHFARMIIVCQNFLLHNWRLRHWPQHFIYHGPAFGFSKQTIGDDLRLMAGICFGGHGFGTLFSENSPLVVLVTGNDRESAEALVWTTTEELHADLGRIVVKAWWPGY